MGIFVGSEIRSTSRIGCVPINFISIWKMIIKVIKKIAPIQALPCWMYLMRQYRHKIIYSWDGGSDIFTHDFACKELGRRMGYLKIFPHHQRSGLNFVACLVTPNGDVNLGQHWLTLWLVAWRHQTITLINVDICCKSCFIIFNCLWWGWCAYELAP